MLSSGARHIDAEQQALGAKKQRRSTGAMHSTLNARQTLDLSVWPDAPDSLR